MSTRLERAWVVAYLLLVIASAGWLRFHDVGEQLLGGDEYHTTHVALTRSYREALTYYSPHDNSLALTLYAKAMMDGPGLTEMGLRAPIMLAGTLLLLAPLLLIRRSGPAGPLAALTLFATAPPLVFYSIVARPYAPSALLVFLALLAWLRWMRSGTPGAGIAFALAGAGATVFHLLAVAPVGLLGLLSLGAVRRREIPGRQWIAVALSAALVIAAFLAPGLESMIGTHGEKIGGTPRDASTLLAAYRQMCGHLISIQIAMGVLPIVGIHDCARRDRTLALALASVLAGELLAILVLQPVGGAGAWARYYSIVWPIWLLAAGFGLAACGRGLARLWRPARAREEGFALLLTLALAGAIAMTLPALSPIALFRASPNSFRSGKSMLHPMPAAPTAVSEVYATVARDPDRGDVLVRYPAVKRNTKWIGLLAHQQMLDMRIVMASDLVPLFRRRGLFLKNVIDITRLEEVEATCAKYLVLGRDRFEPGTRAAIQQRYGGPAVVGANEELFAIGRAGPGCGSEDPHE